MAGVITQCRVDFVRLPPFLPAIWEADFFFFLIPCLVFQDDGPYKYLYDLFFMSTQSLCTDSCVFLREDVVTALKNVNAKGTFFFSL